LTSNNGVFASFSLDCGLLSQESERMRITWSRDILVADIVSLSRTR
jgi:hypothetical protein